MDRRLVLAKAGAGKTFYICNSLNQNIKTVIISYTNNNIDNLKRELFKRFGEIPPKITCVTFHTLILNLLVYPYTEFILQTLRCDSIVITGVTNDEPDKSVDKLSWQYYITTDGQLYLNNIPSLIVSCAKNDRYMSIVNGVLDYYYDCVYVDEFQDFRQCYFDLLMMLTKNRSQVVMVGDFFQHSVVGMNNTGKPFKNGKVDIGYEAFVHTMNSDFCFKVEDELLCNSRRCSSDVCDFVTQKLGISIGSCSNRKGEVRWVEKEELYSILNDNQIKKIVYKDSSKFIFDCVNWGYSKGDTYKETCVILTKDATSALRCNKIATLSASTLNKLYVAITRSLSNVWLVEYKSFNLVKNEFIRQVDRQRNIRQRMK